MITCCCDFNIAVMVERGASQSNYTSSSLVKFNKNRETISAKQPSNKSSNHSQNLFDADAEFLTYSILNLINASID